MKTLRSLRHAALSAIAPILLSGLAVVSASAQTSTWKIDPVHSGVEFRILHLGVSHVNGTFSKPTGIIHLDEKDITKSSVEATIEVGTLNTSNDGRDNHLKTPEFFNLAQFPTITFKSTSIVKDGGKLKLIGDLTLAGVTKPVTLTVDGPAAPQKGMHDTIVSGFSATGSISRKDFNFGQKYQAPILGDDVTFTIDLEIDKQ